MLHIYEATVCAYVFVSSSFDIIFLLFFRSIHPVRSHAHIQHDERSEAKNAKTLSSPSSPLLFFLICVRFTCAQFIVKDVVFDVRMPRSNRDRNMEIFGIDPTIFVFHSSRSCVESICNNRSSSQHICLCPGMNRKTHVSF